MPVVQPPEIPRMTVPRPIVRAEPAAEPAAPIATAPPPRVVRDDGPREGRQGGRPEGRRDGQADPRQEQRADARDDSRRDNPRSGPGRVSDRDLAR